MNYSAILALLVSLAVSGTDAFSTASRSAENIRLRRSEGLAEADLAGDSIGNPANKSWVCTPEMGVSCTFRTPVTLTITDFWFNTDLISQRKQSELVMEAARKWEAVTNDLRFEWALPGQAADIEVFFAFIDGPHGAIGRASDPSPDDPEATWVRLDDAEEWSVDDFPVSANGYSLSWALLHEFGHAIGLRHSKNSDDIMYGNIQKTSSILRTGDVIAAQSYYGAPPGAFVAVQTTAPPVFVPASPIITGPTLNIDSGSPSNRPTFMPAAPQNPGGLALVPSTNPSGVGAGVLIDPSSSGNPAISEGSLPRGTNGQSIAQSGVIIRPDPTPPPAESRRNKSKRCTQRQERRGKCTPRTTNTRQGVRRRPSNIARSGKNKAKRLALKSQKAKNTQNQQTNSLSGILRDLLPNGKQ